MPELKLCFAGTPAFAADHLSCLLKAKHDVVAVYTQPDRPAGRGKKLMASPVKQLAVEHGLLVKQPKTLRAAEAQQELADLNPDLLIVVAYGLILPQEILDIPKLGCINVHASLLPRWRGAAPIERALLSGDKETGVTIMQMDAGLDTGPMLHSEAVEISPEDDRESLTSKLSTAGQQALLYTLQNLMTLRDNAQVQDDSKSTYADKLEKKEAMLNWQLPAESLGLVVRAGIGRFPAYSFLEGQRIRILRAEIVNGSYDVAPGTIVSADELGALVACGEQALKIESVQLPGKNPCTIKDLLNSNNSLFTSGHKFSDVEGS